MNPPYGRTFLLGQEVILREAGPNHPFEPPIGSSIRTLGLGYQVHRIYHFWGSEQALVGEFMLLS